MKIGKSCIDLLVQAQTRTLSRLSQHISDLSFGLCRNETDITERLKSIIKANASLRSEMAETDSQSRCMV